MSTAGESGPSGWYAPVLSGSFMADDAHRYQVSVTARIVPNLLEESHFSAESIELLGALWSTHVRHTKRRAGDLRAGRWRPTQARNLKA